MRNPIQNRSARTCGPAFLLAAWAFLASSPGAAAHELKDVSLITAAGQSHLKLTFASMDGESEYPLYYQKADSAKGTVFLSFLETETAFPLGRHLLEPNSPDLEEFLLKKVTTPSGKFLLGVELKYRQPPSGDAVLQPAPGGALKVMLGKGKGKYSWSLSNSLKAGNAYLAAKAEAPPARAGAEAGKPVVAGESPASVHPKAEPPAAPTETFPNAATEIPAVLLEEVRLDITPAQANLLLIFNPPAAPNYLPRKNAKDSSWLELVLDNAGSGLGKQEYLLPKNAVYKKVSTVAKGARLTVRIQLAPAENVTITPQANGLELSGLIQAGNGVAIQWTSRNPAGKENGKTGAGGEAMEEPMPSAFEEGEALDAARIARAAQAVKGAAPGVGTGGGLSSSKIFSPGQSAKAMVLYKDSASLKTEPGPNGKLIKKIPIGGKVVRLDNRAGNLRVVAGTDTGFIKADAAVYEDELTKAQEKTIQGRIEAKQAMIAAAEAKAAAAEAKTAADKARQEEKIRKAEEIALRKAAEKAAADSMKAAAKAAADSAKALAKAQALEKAQALALEKAQAKARAAAPDQPPHIQEAPAPAAAGQKLAGKNPSPTDAGDAQKGEAGAPSALGEPKLAIADNPELAAKLAQEKLAAEEEKTRIEPEEKRISYNSYGRRDPFIPVEQGSIDNGIDIDQMKVVGIIWESQQPMAVLEHNREAGVSFTIKEGDPVHNGRVAHISREMVTFDISEYGISRSYSLKLVSSKEGAKR